MKILTFLGAVLGTAAVLAACGGGGPPASLAPESFSFDYQGTVDVRHSYTAYATRSHAFVSLGKVYIGGDHEPRENLRHIIEQNGIHYSMGASRDGVGVDRLRNYEADLKAGGVGHDFNPFGVQPRLWLDDQFLASGREGLLEAVSDSVNLLNDALPPEYQIRFAGTRPRSAAGAGEIMVNLYSPGTLPCGSASAVACAQNSIPGILTTSATLSLPTDFDVSGYSYTRSTIVHELLHALGIQGHVDSVEFPDSIMGTSGEFFPNIGYVIGRVDREALQIMYMTQRTDLYNDWGEWSDTSLHLMGETDDRELRFGVALFNGLPHPWAKGEAPRTTLAANSSLSGSATWRGSLLGFSGPSPIAGGAQLRVSLSTLSDPANEQDLRFSDIYFLNRIEDADPWFPTRNIDYKVTVTDNGFVNVPVVGETDLVTGAFMGAAHEHMGGTVKRTDMVAAFGGTR